MTTNTPKIRWEDSHLTRMTEYGFVGQIKAAQWSVGWHGGKDEANQYYLTCDLASIKNRVYGPSVEVLKARAEKQLETYKQLLDGTYESKEKGPLA